MFRMLVLKVVLTKEFQSQFYAIASSMVSMYIYVQICYLKGQANADLSSGYCKKAHSHRLEI